MGGCMTELTSRAKALKQAIDRLGLTEKQLKKYDLEIAPRIIARLDQMSPECEKCQEMAQMTDELISISHDYLTNKDARKTIKKKLKEASNHLYSKHQIVRKGFYQSFWLAIGISIGASLMTALDNPAFIGIGIAIGVGAGASMDKKAKLERRVL